MGWNPVTSDLASAGRGGWRAHRPDGGGALKVATGLTIDASIGDVVLTLPSCVANAGRMFVIVRIDDAASTFDATVEPADSTETINGLPSYDDLDAQYDSVTLVATSAGVWVIIGTGV